MTIIECINEKTALNLNPFQVFVFLNQKTKKFENRLRLLANRQQSFNVVFVDDDPRSHIQTSYWSDFENIKVSVMHRKVELRSIRLPKENIVIQDDPLDQEPFPMLVEMMPPLYTLFGIRNRKAISFLKEINKNLVLASENPVMNYNELNMPAYMRRDYLE